MKNTNSAPIKPSAYIKSLQIIHAALVLGPMLFGAFIFYQNERIITNFEMNSDPFLYIVPLVALLGYFASSFLFKKAVSKVTIDDSLIKKQTTYQTASILRYACIEGPTMLALVAFMDTRIILYGVLAVLLIAYLFTQRPSLQKLKQSIPLKQEEERLFHSSRKSN